MDIRSSHQHITLMLELAWRDYWKRQAIERGLPYLP
jgi:hypothetical protein